MASAVTRRSGPSSAAAGPTLHNAISVPEDVQEILEQFRRRMVGEEKSAWTVKQYLFFARHFLNFIDKPLTQVQATDVERYREHLVLVRKYSKNSVYGTLRGVAYLLRSFGLTSAQEVEVPRRSSKLPSFLSEEEAHKLLMSETADPRTDALLHVLGYGGLRVGEVCHLQVDDLDLENALIRVRRGKGDKDRMVVVEETTVKSLRRWLEIRATLATGDLRVFGVSRETVERLVRRAAQDAGLNKRVTPHTLRHTLATTLLKRGLDIRFIQKQLGHASVATTQVYTHVDTSALQEAYQTAKPTY